MTPIFTPEIIYLILALGVLLLPASLGVLAGAFQGIRKKKIGLLAVTGTLLAMFFVPFMTNTLDNALMATLPSLALVGASLVYAKYMLWDGLPKVLSFTENKVVRSFTTVFGLAATSVVSYFAFITFG